MIVDVHIGWLALVMLLVVYITWRGRRRYDINKNRREPDAQYLRGMKLVLRDVDALNTESLVTHLPVNETTFESHAAIGTLLRERGQFFDAVRVHENMMNSGKLAASYTEIVELELAHDYMRAGQFDRAQALLVAAVARPTQRYSAWRLIAEIHEQQKRWSDAVAAIESALKSSPPHERNVAHARLIHYRCEHIEQLLVDNQLAHAQSELNKLKTNEGRGRVLLLTARLRGELGQVREATQILEALMASSLHLPRGVAVVARLLEERMIDDDELKNRVRRLQLADGKAPVANVCDSCGFKAQSELWHCPSCREWGCFKAT